MHPDEHGAPLGFGQGLFYTCRHRREELVAGGGHGNRDEPKRGLRHTSARLRGGKRIDKSGKNHPVLHRRGEQDGVEEILII